MLNEKSVAWKTPNAFRFSGPHLPQVPPSLREHSAQSAAPSSPLSFFLALLLLTHLPLLTPHFLQGFP